MLISNKNGVDYTEDLSILMNYHQILPVWHLKLTSEPTMRYTISATLRLTWHQISCSKALRCECDNKDPQFGGGALLILLSTLQAMCCKMCLSVAFRFVRLHVYRMGLDIVFSFWTRYVASTPTSEVILVTIWYIRPPHHGHTEIRLFQTLTLQHQGQGHGCGQRAKSYSQPSILSIRFLFISHQSDQQFLKNSYFEIWPWNVQGQGLGWGQRSRSHILSSIQLMHKLFISHQSDQPFLRYGQKNVWPWKNTFKFQKKICQNSSFPQDFSKI